MRHQKLKYSLYSLLYFTFIRSLYYKIHYIVIRVEFWHMESWVCTFVRTHPEFIFKIWYICKYECRFYSDWRIASISGIKKLILTWDLLCVCLLKDCNASELILLTNTHKVLPRHNNGQFYPSLLDVGEDRRLICLLLWNTVFSVIMDYVHECHCVSGLKKKKRMFDVALCVVGCVCEMYVKELYMDEHLWERVCMWCFKGQKGIVKVSL